MATNELYKLIHIVGLLMLFFALGGMSVHRDGKPPAICTVLHAIGLLAMLVAGFGRASRMGFPLDSGWILAKIGLWLLLGAMPVLVRKGILAARALGWVVALAAGAFAVYLAIEKPF